MEIKSKHTPTSIIYGHTEPVNRFRTATILVNTRDDKLYGMIYRVRAFLNKVSYKTIEAHLGLNALQITDMIPGLVVTSEIKTNNTVVEGSIHVTADVSKLSTLDRVKLIEDLLNPELLKYSPPMETAIQNGFVSTTYHLPDHLTGIDPVIKRKCKTR